jgi:hypothetical protein
MNVFCLLYIILVYQQGENNDALKTTRQKTHQHRQREYQRLQQKENFTIRSFEGGSEIHGRERRRKMQREK